MRLNGTSDSIDAMSVLIPRFQIMFDERNFRIDAVTACRNDRFDKPPDLDNEEA